MLTTCFLAALLHGIVILGVTFSSQRSAAGGSDAAALEVLLVNDAAPSTAQNQHARYLAQRTQEGSGNAPEGARTLIPNSSAMPLDQAGIRGAAGLGARQAALDTGAENLLATSAAVSRILYFAAPSAAEEASQVAALLDRRPDLGMAANDDGIELRMRGESKNQVWIAADTRESDVAIYLDGWRRKIERVGTLHFPDAARRQKLSGTPVIEVTIGADGRLLATKVRSSSGHAEIDEAAMRILKLAAPYDPFPSALRAKHDEIRIAYQWEFLGGSAQDSSVLYSAPATQSAAP